jgi:hypothetical protein
VVLGAEVPSCVIGARLFGARLFGARLFGARLFGAGTCGVCTRGVRVFRAVLVAVGGLLPDVMRRGSLGAMHDRRKTLQWQRECQQQREDPAVTCV